MREAQLRMEDDRMSNEEFMELLSLLSLKVYSEMDYYVAPWYMSRLQMDIAYAVVTCTHVGGGFDMNKHNSAALRGALEIRNKYIKIFDAKTGEPKNKGGKLNSGRKRKSLREKKYLVLKVNELREINPVTGKRMSQAQACKKVGISEKTFRNYKEFLFID